MAPQYVAAATLVEKFGKLAAASITLGFGKELRCKLRRPRAPAREIAPGKKLLSPSPPDSEQLTPA